MRGDEELKSRGTLGYRAPELTNGSIESTETADIYSLGIILFTLVIGSVPYLENKKVGGYDLHNMLLKQDQEYWSTYQQLCHKNFDFEDLESFKSLFHMMTKEDVIERATITEIKKSKWYNGPTLNDTEYKAIM